MHRHVWYMPLLTRLFTCSSSQIITEGSLRFFSLPFRFHHAGATTCTPEYYINMRTGTHYFPRAAAAHDANRVKFALNKIDEAPLTAASINGGPYTNQQQLLQMQQQQQQLQLQANGLTVASQRRLESMSCEMARRHFPAVVRGLTTTTSTSLVVTESLGFGGNGGTSVGNGHHVLAVASKNLTAATAVAGLSPDVQRRLTIQSYKGMECEWKCHN